MPKIGGNVGGSSKMRENEEKFQQEHEKHGQKWKKREKTKENAGK